MAQQSLAVTRTTATVKWYDCLPQRLPQLLLHQAHHFHQVNPLNTHTHTRTCTLTYTHAQTHCDHGSHKQWHNISFLEIVVVTRHLLKPEWSFLLPFLPLLVAGTTIVSESGYLLAGIVVASITAVFLAVMSLVSVVYFCRWKRRYSRLMATPGINGTRASYISSGSSTGTVSTPTYHLWPSYMIHIYVQCNISVPVLCVIQSPSLFAGQYLFCINYPCFEHFLCHF